MLRQQLNNENLGAEEKAKIQQQIYQNDEKNRKKQDELAKKRFKANKAFAIAEATINTFLGATQALKTDGWLGIARAVATITFGLAQVAMIARQKFVPTASSMPPSAGSGGTSGGDSGREFNYNIVGDTGINQLTELLEDQFGKPLKAYVVSRDMTSQQEFDLAVENESKI